MKAIWNDQVIAESDQTVVVEGNHYFPPTAIKREFYELSDRQTVCPWKGTANYYHLVQGGQRNDNAAWYYPSPKEAASEIKDHVAFYGVVKVSE